MPMMKPLVVCVTRQAELARQPVSASRSKTDIRYGAPEFSARENTKSEAWRQLKAASALVDRSGVALALLPLGFEFENGLPVTALDLGHIRLLRDGGAPADGV